MIELGAGTFTAKYHFKVRKAYATDKQATESYCSYLRFFASYLGSLRGHPYLGSSTTDTIFITRPLACEGGKELWKTSL